MRFYADCFEEKIGVFFRMYVQTVQIFNVSIVSHCFI